MALFFSVIYFSLVYKEFLGVCEIVIFVDKKDMNMI